MITKFEAVGIFTSIAMMAVALFFLNHSTDDMVRDAATSQPAAVVVVDERTMDEDVALGQALASSFTKNGVSKLVIDDVVVGTGDMVKKGDSVSVHYIGRLENGQEFDNSFTRGTPITFTVGDGEVIEGWEQGILGMQVGGQRILVIPASLAYGNKNVGPIPAGSTLLFSVELVAIN